MFCRCRHQLRLAVSPVRHIEGRRYVQQRVPRTPSSTSQSTTTTTNPSPKSQVKNRPSPSLIPAGVTVKTNALPLQASRAKNVRSTQPPTLSEIKAFTEARRAVKEGRMSQAEQLASYRAVVASGEEPWAYKTMLYDLTIPPKPTSFSGIRDNIVNNFKNAQMMFLLATDYAFPGKITSWRYHPQIFRAKSTSENAWVAPFRHEFLNIYQRINAAVAEGDRKVLSQQAAYEYRDHVFELLQRREALMKKYTFQWSLAKLLSPVRIVSLRGGPLYHGRDEPPTGNRNIVQALVQFDTLQTLTCRDRSGRILKPDGSVAEEGYVPKPRKVREHLIFENRMFYTDGWYVRGEVYEGIKPKFGSENIMQ